MGKGFRFKSIRGKINFGFSLIFALLLIMIVLNHLGYKRINGETEEIVDRQFPLALANRGLAMNIAEITADVRGYMLYKDEALLEKMNETIEAGKVLEEEWLGISENDGAQALIATKAEWTALIQKAVAETIAGRTKEADAYLAEARPLTNELNEGFTALLEEREKAIGESGDEIKRTGESTDIFIIILGAAVLLAGILVSYVTARTIVKPIRQVMDRMNIIAEGDLSQEPLTTALQDETSHLVAATNTMSENTRELLNQIAEVSEVVSSQSEELTQSATEVRAGTEQVASTMEELASGAETQANTSGELSNIMGMFSVKVGSANDSGELIEERSDNVLQLTSKGSELMSSSSAQMAKINEIVRDSVRKVEHLDDQSKEISNLVSVIRTIADQTNLLALNAAIEAARAGEEGKGFAVVADEVRKLAEQVAFSVNDITEIVANIQSESAIVVDSLRTGFAEVEQGTDQIETTEATFREISTAVKDMANHIEDISANLGEIASGSEEMNGSIQEIAAVSEEAAAGIEQTAASAEQASSSMEEVAASSDQLSRLAEELNGMVGKFRI